MKQPISTEEEIDALIFEQQQLAAQKTAGSKWTPGKEKHLQAVETLLKHIPEERRQQRVLI